MQRIAQDSVSPSLTESLKPGTLYAMAGVAMALASITTKPHPSLMLGTKSKWPYEVARTLVPPLCGHKK